MCAIVPRKLSDTVGILMATQAQRNGKHTHSVLQPSVCSASVTQAYQCGDSHALIGWRLSTVLIT